MRPLRATLSYVRRLLASASAVAILVAQCGGAFAHTVSIGYVLTGPGAVTFWYGSYHNTATFNEADLQLVGPSYNVTTNMSLITAIKPMGLIDGTNNFYSNTAGTLLVGIPEVVASTDGSGGSFNPATQSILHWQGVSFTGLRPGTYVFTYNPLSVPTVEWHPINDVIRTNTFTLTAQDILGIAGYQFFGTNVNQRAVGTGLDTAIGPGGYNQRIYNIAALAAGPMANALTQLSGEVHTQSSRAAFQPGGSFLSAMMDPLAGGMRGGDFGAAPGSPYGDQPYGAPPGGYYGGDPNSPNSNPAYDPQYPNGNYGPDGGQQYGDAQYGNPSDPGSPYGSGSPNSNSAYGNNQYGDGQYGNGPNGNARYGNGYAENDRYRRGLFHKQPFENRWSLWGTTYGGYSVANGDAVIGSHDTRIQSGGIIAGADYRFAPGGVLGFAMTGGTTSWTLSDALGKGNGDVMQVGVYGSQRFGAAYVSSAAAAGWHKMSTDRTITISGGNDQLRGSFSARTFGGRLETGYRMMIGNDGITPHVAAQFLSFSAPAYGETVASGANDFALDISKRDTTQTRLESGIWLDRRIESRGMPITLRGRIAWVHEWMNAPTVGAVFQTLPGSGFNVIGATPAADRALASIGAEFRLARNWSASVKVDGEFAAGAQSYLGMATLRYQW